MGSKKHGPDGLYWLYFPFCCFYVGAAKKDLIPANRPSSLMAMYRSRRVVTHSSSFSLGVASATAIASQKSRPNSSLVTSAPVKGC